MTFDDVIKHFGSGVAAAKAIGVEPAAVSLWRRNGIGFQRQCQIQLLTGGVLKAEQSTNPKREAPAKQAYSQ